MTRDPRTTEDLRRELARLELKVKNTSKRRFDMPIGATRARITTANARYATACEARDRVLRELELRAGARP
jgi:hypothetical protein